ncbi:MAG: prepilin-type N-terminal cleavage/methylation domain-containing protein [Pseudomonadota bacterium]
MIRSIGRSGFGVIELLVTLLIVSILAATLTKTIRRVLKSEGTDAIVEPVEKQLRADLEVPGARLKGLVPTFLSGDGNRGAFSYRIEGTSPDFRIVRTAPEGGKTLLSHVFSIRFTAYDADGHFLPDSPNPGELAKTTRLRIDLSVCDPTETPGALPDGGVTAIDLDGDPTNGAAKIRTRSFGIVLPAP